MRRRRRRARQADLPAQAPPPPLECTEALVVADLQDRMSTPDAGASLDAYPPGIMAALMGDGLA